MPIAFQGRPGAYSHAAAQTARPDLSPLPCPTFEDMLEAVRDGRADAAMVPVENSVAGRVADIHHLVPEAALHVVGEHFHRVRHQLAAPPGATLSGLREVRSHVQALAQCRRRLASLGLTPVQHTDTAGAAEAVATLGDPTVGALCSRLAVELYGLTTLIEGAEDATHNTTRFLVMARDPAVPDASAVPVLTTLVFSLRSVPAALYKALGGFATNGLNLTRIESYLAGPQMTSAHFWIDVEGHPHTPAFRHALDELRFFSAPGSIRLLGTYPAHPFRQRASGDPPVTAVADTSPP